MITPEQIHKLTTEILGWNLRGCAAGDSCLWYDGDQWTGYSTTYLHTCEHTIWNPPERIEQAFRLAEKIGEFALVPVKMWKSYTAWNRPWTEAKHDEVWWICLPSECSAVIGEAEIWNDIEKGFHSNDERLVKSPAMSICLAALKWLEMQNR